MANAERGLYIVGNWKMNHSFKTLQDFVAQFHSKVDASFTTMDYQFLKLGKVKLGLIPPFLYLEKMFSLVSSLPFPVCIAAQNASWEKKGAFTGEISGPMLQEIQISTVLIGHSERRHVFQENNEMIRNKVHSLLHQGFQIILCLGETQKERETHETEAVLIRQISEVLQKEQFVQENIILAYEPVWAIGTGLTATPEQVGLAHQVIRRELNQRYGAVAAEKTKILYGGSVTPENMESLMSVSEVDGALIGGASLNPEAFFSLLKSGLKIMQKTCS